MALSRCVTIASIGSVDQIILEHLAELISTKCGLPCKVSSGMEIPDDAYDKDRLQYNSKLILRHLIQAPIDSMRYIGVTHVDLYVPILKYVFGLAQLEGQCAVISIHRLRPQFYSRPPDLDLLIARSAKTAIHELGHSLGLAHCRDRSCVMYTSTRIEDTDLKKPDFCPTCLELFNWHMKTCLPPAKP
ncbi:MAG: archaemetzincin [Proteobacteria bacterium]|nr:archaemetzincin [Pseudomonadota bacterium]